MKYKNYSRFLVILTICAIILPLAVGCANKTDKSEETKNFLQSDCKIVYSSDIAPETFERIQALQTEIKDVCGMELELKDDFVKSEDGIKDVQEIIVGNSMRSETKTAMDSTDYYDYSIKTIGKKIVVVAHTQEMLYEAIADFTEKMLTVTDAGVEIAEEYYLESERNGFFEQYGDISKYRVVIQSGNVGMLDLADKLRVAINNEFNVSLPVVTDKEQPNGYEILLGETNRALFVDYYRGDKKPGALHYSICAREGNLLLYGGSEYANDMVIKRFIEDFKNEPWTDRFELPSDIEKCYAAYDRDDEHTERTEGTDVRIMSYNMLSAELSPDKPDFEDRAEMVLSVVLNYMPDVVGFQEVSEKGYGIIESYVGDTYEIPLKKTPNDEYSFTGLMYNKNTVSYKEGGNHVYTVGNKRIRIISWGLFELKSSGQQFVAISTHWDIVLDHRPQQAAQMAEYINGLKEKYGCPVITTGDYNTREGTEYYQTYLERTGQTDARHTAETVGYASKDDVIDHITATVADTQTLFFKLIDTDYTKKASDHDPIFADYKFK